MNSILIDSSTLLAMVDAGDKYHVAAAAFARVQATATFYLPEPVFIETMVLTKARLGAKPAVELGNRIMESARFPILHMIEGDRHTTWEIFSRYTDKDWSYVDCSILAMARRLGLSEVFTFDRHFDQMAELARVPVE